MNEPKRISITDAKTGEVRFSEPYSQSGPRAHVSKSIDNRSEVTDPVRTESARGTDLAVKGPADTATGAVNKTTKQRAKTKPKVEIETFGQFIAYAYGKKGRKVSLEVKVERVIAQEPRLTIDEIERIAHLVKRDNVLAVPRQLLLAARAVRGSPNLRAALRAFVRDVLLGHPLFMQRGVEAAIRNLEEASNPADALKLLAGSDKQLLRAGIAKEMKANEFELLRINAVNCMAVWIADVKGLSMPAVADALFVALWRPRATALEHDTARLRALTEIDQLAGVGLVGEEYRRQVAEKHAQADTATREASLFRESARSLGDELTIANKTIESQEAAMAAMAAEFAEVLEGLKTSSETEAAHLRDDIELLRTRVLRRLKADVELLELGLEALRRPEPKVHVMMDSAERVADALRKEVRNLQGSE